MSLTSTRHLRLSSALLAAVLATLPSCASLQPGPRFDTTPVTFYDFEHPLAGDPTREVDRGASGTPLQLVNGGSGMRVADGAHPGSRFSLQTQQIAPGAAGNDDWKAGVYAAAGVPSMSAFGSTSGITLMGWLKPTGANPAMDTGTPDPGDRYGAVGLFGILSGNSEGHAVRALIEIIDVAGTLRLVALGRRVDGGSSRTLAATDDWRVLLPANTWTHIAATFDYDTGAMALYRNGVPLAATYTSDADAWAVNGAPEPDLASAAAPTGIKYRRQLSAEHVGAQHVQRPARRPNVLRQSLDGRPGAPPLRRGHRAVTTPLCYARPSHLTSSK